MAGFYDAVMVGGREPWHVPTTAGLLPCVAENTLAIPVNDEAALEEALATNDIGLLLCEPWGGYSGITGIAPSFYQAMRDLTIKHGTILMFDEVVSAFRFAPGGIQAVKGILPDLTSLGKNITGGLPGAGAIVGREDIMDMLSSKDAEWNRYKRVPHSGTFNGNPLCAAAGVATLKILATGEPQRQAIQMTALLHDGMNQVIGKLTLDGCAYGEGPSIHLHLGGCQMRGGCDRVTCLNDTKARSESVGEALGMNLTLHGVHTKKGAGDFHLSAAHTRSDIEKTVKAFNASLVNMINDKVVATG